MLDAQRTTPHRSEASTEHRASSIEYRYELVQDLRSQLIEEELRSQDRNAALLDVDREMSRYRPYLGLSPDEARARAATAPPEEKPILEHLASKGWGPAQMYYRLSPRDLAALREGRELQFVVTPSGADPEPGQQPLPPELARGVLTSLRDYRVVSRGDRYDVGTVRSLPDPDGVLPAAVPGARAVVTLRILANELGQLTLQGLAGFTLGTPPNAVGLRGDGERDMAVGISPSVRKPQNAAANAKLARDPALQRRVTVKGQDLMVNGPWLMVNGRRVVPPPSTINHQPSTIAPQPSSLKSKVTTGDVLEALHRATGLPIVADYYTRLYAAEAVALPDLPLFDALNRLADAMRLRWGKDGEWLQFRSASYFNDRLKEVPNRLLERWAASRRQHGVLALEDLIEIAGLANAQLDSRPMAEGARVLFGLEEWPLASNGFLRPHLRYLGEFSPTQRQEAQSAAGLAFAKMTLGQQQEFLRLALGSRPDALQPRLEELAGAVLRVDYVLPGAFEWSGPTEPGRRPEFSWRLPAVRERTHEAAVQAARRIDPQVEAAQIVPTELGMTIAYAVEGAGRRFRPGGVRANPRNTISTSIRAE